MANRDHKTLGVRIGRSLWDRLTAHARRVGGASRGAIMRQALEQFLDNEDHDNETATALDPADGDRGAEAPQTEPGAGEA